MFNQTSLTIVYTEGTEEYANYLQLMLSSNDDNGDNIVGVKDGSVSAAVWSEKQYLDNKPKISNNQHVLFIGKSKQISKECFGMQEKFSKFGMKYSWLGKRGMLCVDHSIKRKEYDDFIEYARNYVDGIQKKMDSKGKTAAKDIVSVGVGVAAEAASVGAGIGAAAGVAVLLPFAAALFAPGAVFGGIAAGSKVFRSIKERQAVMEQQYTCLILKFYMDGIIQFLNQ